MIVGVDIIYGVPKNNAHKANSSQPCLAFLTFLQQGLRECTPGQAIIIIIITAVAIVVIILIL